MACGDVECRKGVIVSFDSDEKKIGVWRVGTVHEMVIDVTAMMKRFACTNNPNRFRVGQWIEFPLSTFFAGNFLEFVFIEDFIETQISKVNGAPAVVLKTNVVFPPRDAIASDRALLKVVYSKDVGMVCNFLWKKFEEDRDGHDIDRNTAYSTLVAYLPGKNSKGKYASIWALTSKFDPVEDKELLDKAPWNEKNQDRFRLPQQHPETNIGEVAAGLGSIRRSPERTASSTELDDVVQRLSEITLKEGSDVKTNSAVSGEDLEETGLRGEASGHSKSRSAAYPQKRTNGCDDWDWEVEESRKEPEALEAAFTAVVVHKYPSYCIGWGAHTGFFVIPIAPDLMLEAGDWIMASCIDDSETGEPGFKRTAVYCEKRADRPHVCTPVNETIVADTVLHSLKKKKASGIAEVDPKYFLMQCDTLGLVLVPKHQLILQNTFSRELKCRVRLKVEPGNSLPWEVIAVEHAGYMTDVTEEPQTSPISEDEISVASAVPSQQDAYSERGAVPTAKRSATSEALNKDDMTAASEAIDNDGETATSYAVDNDDGWTAVERMGDDEKQNNEKYDNRESANHVEFENFSEVEDTSTSEQTTSKKRTSSSMYSDNSQDGEQDVVSSSSSAMPPLSSEEIARREAIYKRRLKDVRRRTAEMIDYYTALHGAKSKRLDLSILVCAKPSSFGLLWHPKFGTAVVLPDHLRDCSSGIFVSAKIAKVDKSGAMLDFDFVTTGPLVPSPSDASNPELRFKMGYLEIKLFINNTQSLTVSDEYGNSYVERIAEVGPVLIQAERCQPGDENKFFICWASFVDIKGLKCPWLVVSHEPLIEVDENKVEVPKEPEYPIAMPWVTADNNNVEDDGCRNSNGRDNFSSADEESGGDTDQAAGDAPYATKSESAESEPNTSTEKSDSDDSDSEYETDENKIAELVMKMFSNERMQNVVLEANRMDDVDVIIDFLNPQDGERSDDEEW